MNIGLPYLQDQGKEERKEGKKKIDKLNNSTTIVNQSGIDVLYKEFLNWGHRGVL